MNKYLEKLAVTLEVDGDRKVTSIHETGSKIDTRADNAKLVNPYKSTSTRRVFKRSAKFLAAGAAGAGAVYGVKKLIDKARSMQKQAMDLETKKELMNSATIGAIGVGTGILGHRIGAKLGKSFSESALKMGALSGGLGLLGDYGAVKLNKSLNHKADSYVSTKNPEGIK